MLRAVLFDLDGVLVDSLDSIAGSMNHALVSMGRPAHPHGALRRFVGPPIEGTAAHLLGTSDAASVAAWVDCYRRHYDETCVRDARPAPGLADAIPRLAARLPLGVATAKPEVYAER